MHEYFKKEKDTKKQMIVCIYTHTRNALKLNEALSTKASIEKTHC